MLDQQVFAEKFALDQKCLVEVRENIALRARNFILENLVQEKDKQIAELDADCASKAQEIAELKEKFNSLNLHVVEENAAVLDVA